MVPIPRFFDAKHEYLYKVRRMYLSRRWNMTSPWSREGGAELCLTEAKRAYQSDKYPSDWVQPLSLRKKVHFGILIRYNLEHQRTINPPPTIKAKQSQKTMQPAKPPSTKLQHLKLPLKATQSQPLR